MEGVVVSNVVMDMLRGGIVRTIRLGATLIANEYQLAPTVLQLIQVRHSVLDIYDAPKHPKMVHHQLLPMPCLKWGHVIHALRRTPVQHIYSNTHRFTPEPSRKALSLQHAPSG
jgi:hypothetical protein